jgi:hypothetical protein
MYGLTFKWRLTRIENDLAELYVKHGEDLAVELMTATPFRICPYHVECAANDRETKDEIRANQKECPTNPDPNYFLNGYCSRYRSVTGGHCDRHDWEKDDE